MRRFWVTMIVLFLTLPAMAFVAGSLTVADDGPDAPDPLVLVDEAETSSPDASPSATERDRRDERRASAKPDRPRLIIPSPRHIHESDDSDDSDDDRTGTSGPGGGDDGAGDDSVDNGVPSGGDDGAGDDSVDNSVPSGGDDDLDDDSVDDGVPVGDDLADSGDSTVEPDDD